MSQTLQSPDVPPLVRSWFRAAAEELAAALAPHVAELLAKTAPTPPEAPALPEALTIQQVIKITGMSRSTIDRWEAAGKFPERDSKGKIVRWDRDEVLAFKANRWAG